MGGHVAHSSCSESYKSPWLRAGSNSNVSWCVFWYSTYLCVDESQDDRPNRKLLQRSVKGQSKISYLLVNESLTDLFFGPD